MKFDAETIRCDVVSTLVELEFDGLIYIPDDYVRAEFIDDCVGNVLDKFDLYENYTPDYVAELLDLAKVYGYGEGI